MAAAGELRCVDRFCHQVCFRRHRQRIHFERGTEKRDQGICRSMFLDVFTVLPTGFGESLIYQLARFTYYVALIGCTSIQLSEEAFFFPWFG